MKFVHASGEPILDTQRYLAPLYSTFSNVKFYSTFCYVKLFSASGEAILDTQRYLDLLTVRYLEARFATIAVYHPPVFFLARGG